LAANNLTLPSGQLPEDGSSIPVSTTGSFSTLDQIRNLVVGVKLPASAGGGGTGPGVSTPGASPSPAASQPPATTPSAPLPITIGQLGTVEQAAVATTGYARTNSEPSITVTVSKSSGANTVDVADRVQAELAAAQERNPDLVILTVSDLSVFIKESRDGLLKEGGLGALFAILTIFLFLFSLRSTLVAAVSIPLSIFAAITLMLIAGISMNIMTLGGLAVAIGRVVDDAIVVLENIYRHRARGDDRRAAVLTGTR
jgi:HAE1 family hydrophobic/amphiphilic exporter-1